MTEKRYKVHNMVKGMNVGESVDLELMKELTEKYGAYENVDVEIMDNGKTMTYKEVVELLNENELLKNINGIHRSALLDSEYDIKKLEEENERLKEKIYKLCNFIEDKINETEEDLKRAVKAGMITTICYSDLDLLEEIRKKLRE